MASGRTAVVLGGGVGGVVAARHLRKALPTRDRVVLVDRTAHHLFQPSLIWLTIGRRTPEQVTRPLARLRARGIAVITGEVEAIEPAQRSVTVGGQAYAADALIIALGAELAEDAVPGLMEAGHNLYSLAGAAAAADMLRRFAGGRVAIVTAAPAYKCPAAPYEAALLVHDHLRRHHPSAEVALYAAEAGPMLTAGPDVSAAVRAMVESRGVVYHPAHQIERVDGARRQLHFAGGAVASFDLLLYVPPHRAPAVVRTSGLAAPHGWISVDPATLATAHQGVFALGDVTAIPIASGKLLPKAGVFAHSQARVVAANLAAAWRGRSADRSFDGRGSCFIETGAGQAGFGAGDFYATPAPQMRLYQPARWWHWGKVLFEQRWLHSF